MTRKYVTKVVTLLAAAGVLAAAVALAALPQQKVGPRHREWLEAEVVYIISKEERDLFQRLPSDADRDKFVDQFWARRDPTPGTAENEAKDEHYRRIRYANMYFGNEAGNDGWRTDRGKIYIILGAPATRQQYPSASQVYPIELWFYSSPNEPSLPPFFNVMFYQKDGVADYRLYSPYIDGPNKLVRAAGSENRNDRAYRFLRDFNVEVASASLSLIPSDPGDVEAGPSLASDAMLSKIINLANDRFHKEKIGLTAKLQQDVSVRILPDVSNLRAVAVPIQNVNGQQYLHYSLQAFDPTTFTLGRYKEKYYVTLEAQVRLLDAKTRQLVSETTREATEYFEDKEADEVRTKPISFEDRIPIAPGDYTVEFGLLNRVTRIFSRATVPVEVEAAANPAFRVGKPLLVWRCQPSADLHAPFVFGTFRCGVSARNEVLPGAASTLNLLYSIQAGTMVGKVGPALKVQYTIGRPDRGIEPRVITDTVDRGRFDKDGRLYVGKSLSLKDLIEGNYLVSILVTDEVSRKSAGTTWSFRLSSSGTQSGMEFKVIEPDKTPPQ
jgi:GWxTD domain-containing protein